MLGRRLAQPVAQRAGGGDLQAETSWLLLVAHAYTHHKSQDAAEAETSDVSARSGS